MGNNMSIRNVVNFSIKKIIRIKHLILLNSLINATQNNEIIVRWHEFLQDKPYCSNFGFTLQTNFIDTYGGNQFFYSCTTYSRYIKLDGYNNTCFLIMTTKQEEFLHNLLKKAKINYEKMYLQEWKSLIKNGNAYIATNGGIDIINFF